jgi:hypothetical protein
MHLQQITAERVGGDAGAGRQRSRSQFRRAAVSGRTAMCYRYSEVATGRQCPLRAEWCYGRCRNAWEDSTMPHVKHASKRKRMKEALPVLGAVGMSLSLAGGASAATGEPATHTPLWNPSHEITLYEEEVFDVSLGTFFVFDKENAGTVRLGEKLARGCRGCARGCAVGGGAGGRSKGGCGGCGCGQAGGGGCGGAGGGGGGCGGGGGGGGCGGGGSGCGGGAGGGCGGGGAGCGGCGCCLTWGACRIC